MNYTSILQTRANRYYALSYISMKIEAERDVLYL